MAFHLYSNYVEISGFSRLILLYLFTAPSNVSADTNLAFKLTVADSKNASDGEGKGMGDEWIVTKSSKVPGSEVMTIVERTRLVTILFKAWIWLQI
jgi:hypothetical protein